MSIANSLTNALSGLTASARRVEVVSANIANSETPGYVRREVVLTSHNFGGIGGGVKIEGVARMTDHGAVQDRRNAAATHAQSKTVSDFFSRLELTTGLPNEPHSLLGRISQLEGALIEAASRPDSEIRLRNLASAASALAGKINSISDEIQLRRVAAEQSIEKKVAALNNGLKDIASLNGAITRQLTSGEDASALFDQRQRAIDMLSEIVPIRQVQRENGGVALFTAGGASLLDGAPAVLGFERSPLITPDMTIESGGLSGLKFNGKTVSSVPSGIMGGGSLTADFHIRDTITTTAQSRIDAVARDIVSRFQDPAADPTIGADDPGLFTDAGAAFDPENEIGLAGRIELNVAVDPARGGEPRLLRDGLGAENAVDTGNADGIQRLLDALNDPRQAESGDLTNTKLSFAGLAAQFLSAVGGARQTAEADTAFANAQLEMFTEAELRSGVDKDAELQQLLLIESSFAANARVIQTVDEMLEALLRL